MQHPIDEFVRTRSVEPPSQSNQYVHFGDVQFDGRVPPPTYHVGYEVGIDVDPTTTLEGYDETDYVNQLEGFARG